MASLQKTYTGDLTTSIARQIMAAAGTADAAKQNAMDVANAYGVDPMLRPGEFFAHALGARATSFLPRRFQRKVPNVTMKDPSYISRGQSSPFASPVGPFTPTGGGGGRPSGSGSGGGGVIFPEIVNRTPFDGLIRKPTISNTNPRSKAIVVQDRALGNFLAAVSISLSSSLNSLNQKADETTEGIVVAKDGIDKTYKKLEQSSDSLDSKLDAIIEALRYSNNQEKVLADKREISAKQTEQSMETDMSTANRVLMQDMDAEEIRQMQQEDLADDDRGIPETSMPQNAQQLDLNLPEFAEGGIASGPDSGYLAVLHGDEAVIPLDNNYTQNQPSAIGQKPIATMPMMAERGTDNADSMTPTFRPNISMASSPSISLGSGGGGSGMGEMLSKAIQLPAKAAGLVTMGLMNKVLRSGNISPKVAAHLKSMSAPISAAFGVPDILTSDLRSEEDGKEDYSSVGGGKRRREKGLFGRFKDWIMGTGGSSYGRGGSLYGRGGSTTYNRMSVNGTGGYGYGGIVRSGGGAVNLLARVSRDKKKSGIPKEILDANPHLDPTKPGDYIKLKRMTLPLREASNSEFFTKNVAYNNAFDYNESQFNSPNYGLKTSEIAYNMSMQDEVNGMIDGLVDPESQVVMNNANVNKNGGDQQIEYSAIAVRGNPLKDGTYISPYAV